MDILHGLACFFGGAFSANAIPHVVNGVSGRKFPERSPFRREGEPESAFERCFFSPIGNVLWGLLNMIVAFVLVNTCAVKTGLTADMVLFGAGFAAVALFLAWNIGRVHGKKGD